MNLASTGLQTYIWNNQLKSVLILFLFPILLLGMIYCFFGALGMQQGGTFAQSGLEGVKYYAHWAFLGALIWFSIAWAFHGTMVQMATGARTLTRAESPELYNMVENLCISRGMTMPKLQMIDTPMMNAFASGIGEKSYCITVTRGIVEALSPEEIEAVLAHELSHIRHKDVRLLITTVIFVGMISFACQMIYRMLVYGGSSVSRRREGQDGRMLLIALAVLAVGYGLALILRFSLSRKREYLADAGAVELTKNPDAMIGALQKISGKTDLPDMPEDIKQMCLENTHSFMGLFATHPPIEKRIAALVGMGGRELPSSGAGSPAHGPWSQPTKAWSRPHGPWK